MKEILKLEHIQKYYGNGGNITKAIQDISFSVKEGEFVGIMGASGSGKTTLLNCISTIDTVSAGHIFLDGVDVTEISDKNIAKFRRENLGFIFQDFNLLDTLTISENIALALTINKIPAGKIDNLVRDMAGKLNIMDIMDKYPYQVSGGQKQRCACARAIINDPKLILADEPTGALDSHSSQMLLSTIQTINEKLGATILMVTHLSDHMAIVGAQDKKIYPQTVLPIVADAQDLASIQNGINKVMEQFKSIDIAVHNACLCTFESEESTDYNIYQKVMDINFFGALRLAKTVLPYMRKAQKGRIIFTSSGVGVTGFMNISPYAASKGAIESLAKCLEIENLDYGITFHLFHPPLTNTASAKGLPIPKEFKANAQKVGKMMTKMTKRAEQKQ